MDEICKKLGELIGVSQNEKCIAGVPQNVTRRGI